MKVSALRGENRTIYVEVEGEEEKVKVVYAPGNLTFGLGERIEEAVAAGTLTESAGMLELLDTILVFWDLEEDLVDEDGKATGETRQLTTHPKDLKKVPIPFIGLVFQKIQEDSAPNAKSGPTSENGSLQTELSEGSPSGTSSFGPRSTTESPLGN